MKVLVSDTSVLIDLERGSFLEIAFRLPFEFAVPDLLYERELKDYDGDALMGLGLLVEGLDGSGVALALNYQQRRRSLSLPDSFALALAKANSWTLLTGDAGLRKLAADERVDCHGVLWLLDRMFEGCTADGNKLHTGLQAIGAHPRYRLPKSEINKRLQAYSSP